MTNTCRSVRCFGGTRKAHYTAVNHQKWNNRGQLGVMPVLPIEQWEDLKAKERIEGIIGRYVLFLYT